MSGNSFKKQARRRQKATGESYMRARRQVANNSPAAAAGAVPGSAGEARLLSLLDLGSAGAADVSALWTSRDLPVGTGESVILDDVLRVPFGLGAGGAPVWLDLKDDAAGGVGPHGVMIGATGSGKSTALQSMLVGLCAQHSSDLLQLVLVDDGDSTVFDELANYRHTEVRFRGGDCKAGLMDLIKRRTEALAAADAITLEYDGATSFVDDRSVGLSQFTEIPEAVVNATRKVRPEELLSKIDEQLQERAAMLANPVPISHGPAGSIARYNQVRSTPAGADLPAVPYTLVVVEEFGVLAHSDPDLVTVVDTVMRTGRHLGISVLVVSQILGPWGGTILTNAGYRMVSRTVDAETSLQLIGSDDAYHLPPRDRGVGLFCPYPGAEPVLYRGFQTSFDRVRDLARQTAAVQGQRRAAQSVNNHLRKLTSEHPEMAAIVEQLDARAADMPPADVGKLAGTGRPLTPLFYDTTDERRAAEADALEDVPPGTPGLGRPGSARANDA